MGMESPETAHQGLMTPTADDRGRGVCDPPRGGFFAFRPTHARCGLQSRRLERGTTLESYLWITLGSALGGAGRYWCSGLVARHLGETFPWGTLVVNILGSFVIGFIDALTAPDGRVLAGTPARQFVMAGLCGGYTTFSSFSLQTLNLANDGEWLFAGANIVVSVVLCLVAVWLGHVAAGNYNAMRWV